MITRFDPPETVAQLRSIDTEGNDVQYDDCVAGIQITEGTTFQIDLRNLRPIRINDRGNLIIELELSEVMAAIAEGIKENWKQE